MDDTRQAIFARVPLCTQGVRHSSVAMQTVCDEIAFEQTTMHAYEYSTACLRTSRHRSYVIPVPLPLISRSR